jgi:phage terminase large subunit GpA-like protein
MSLTVTCQQNTSAELNWFLDSAQPRRVRTMRQFAEQEIIIPDGPYAGRRFRCHRQPYTALWFDAVDSGRWNRCVATGPTQSGKTLCAWVIPLMYHLLELQETVICGLPDMDMARDKWREDLLPVLEQSAFRDLIPQTGAGSRGGTVDALRFRNGATLRFMTGGGGDKSRAGFTSRVVVITETDGMDRPGISSRESDKITQLEARTRAYGSRKRIYLECTVSTEQGRTWQEYEHGTHSRILVRCPACQKWVAPEREHLVGWQEAPSQIEARQQGHFRCGECAAAWTDRQRAEMNAEARLVHEGQTLADDGEPVGMTRPTETLGFRWSAFHNLFLSAGDLAADEWRGRHADNEENAEKELRQFVWCLPVAPSKWDETTLRVEELARRMTPLPRGILPKGCLLVTAGIDLGKYLCHWVVVAWTEHATGHIVDYGRLEVASVDLGVEQGLMAALRQFRDDVTPGWPVEDDPEQQKTANVVWIDAGYMTDVVYTFVRESGAPFCPAVGRGAAQQRTQWYNRPTRTGSVVKHIGEGFHLNRLRDQRLHLAEVNADHWKTWVHQRLSTPVEQPGALTLFQSQPKEHLSFARHLTAEVKTEEFISGKGLVTKWERLRRNNHWLDALYNACAAASLAGVRLIDSPATVPQPRRKYGKLSELQAAKRREQGFDTQRWDEMVTRWGM